MAAFPDDLYDVQVELLAAAVGALDYIPVEHPELDGAPLRQGVVPPGQVVIDCDQVVVNVSAVGVTSTGPFGGKKHVHGRITAPTLTVTVSRCCVPIGTATKAGYTPPTPDELSESARQLSADGWALWNGIFTRLVEAQLLDRCTQVEWQAMNPLGPLGRCAGWELNLGVRLAGYMEELGS